MFRPCSWRSHPKYVGKNGDLDRYVHCRRAQVEIGHRVRALRMKGKHQRAVSTGHHAVRDAWDTLRWTPWSGWTCCRKQDGQPDSSSPAPTGFVAFPVHRLEYSSPYG